MNVWAVKIADTCPGATCAPAIFVWPQVSGSSLLFLHVRFPLPCPQAFEVVSWGARLARWAWAGALVSGLEAGIWAESSDLGLGGLPGGISAYH